MKEMKKIHTPSDTPDEWVMIHIEATSTYKIFGSWFGGYLEADKWKLNSGIKTVEEGEDYYYFYGFSGSCYRCHKGNYATGTNYTSGVLDDLIEKSGAIFIGKDSVSDVISKINQSQEDESK